MHQFTLITPKYVARVRARSYAHIENAAKSVGIRVLGIHKDGDTGFYDPNPPQFRGPKRETTFSRAFQGVAA